MPKEKRLNGFGTAVLILISSIGMYILSQLFLIPYNVSLHHKMQNLSAQIQQLRSDNAIQHAQIDSLLEQLELMADNSQ